jgi:hypothetical protein
VPWSQKTREQRIEYMGLVFFPEMKTLFQSHDPEGFRQFRCQTCHGEDMARVHYRMPHALSALPAEEAVHAGSTRNAKRTRFMVDEVVPAMRRLLEGHGPVDAACASCHPKD